MTKMVLDVIKVIIIIIIIKQESCLDTEIQFLLFCSSLRVKTIIMGQISFSSQFKVHIKAVDKLSRHAFVW